VISAWLIAMRGAFVGRECLCLGINFMRRLRSGGVLGFFKQLMLW